MTETLPDFSDLEIEVTTPGLEPAFGTLPQAFLMDGLSPQLLRRIKGEPGFALLVVAPSTAWIEPLAEAVIGLRGWSSVIVGDAKARRPPSSDLVSRKLAAGLSVVAIASVPGTQLPECIPAAADATVKLGVVGNAAIARAIELATGEKPPELPPRIAAGLDYHDIVSAIRVGTSPADCVARLKAASLGQAGQVPNDDVVPIQQLHGYGAAHGWAMRLLDDVARWRRNEIDFASLDRCVVLASRPGLGKTSFVRSLAKSAGLPLVATTASDWFTGQSDGYLGGVLREVERVFTNAAAMAPCVLLIDELDALPSRSSTGRNSDFWTPVITRILVMLDGATSGPASRLIVVGATNHADRLDPALVRPGRLNRIITIHPPGANELAGILRHHLRDDLPGHDLTIAANLAQGATGAQVADWVKEAREAARRAGRPIAIDDLVKAIAPEDRRPAADLFRAAVHEAGHAVVADRIWPGSVMSVSLVARGSFAGLTGIEPRRELLPTRSMIEDRVVVLLAGRSAEIAVLGSASVGSGGTRASDLGVATRELAAIHASFGLGGSALYLADRQHAADELGTSAGLRQAVSSDLARLERRALRVVRRLRQPIVGVARELVKRRVMDSDAFASVRDRWPVAKRASPHGRR